MNNDFSLDKRFLNGLTYEDYSELMIRTYESANQKKLEGEEKKRHEATQLNIQRAGRIDRTYHVTDSLCEKIQQIEEPQLWMVLTEPWCGDSAQNLPYINKFAQCNSNINLRLLLRDQNLDIMDNYMTNGMRSIPLLVAFNSEGNELFRWGSRPKEAAELFAREKQAGLSKDEILIRLHLWYGRNRGKAIEQEFFELLAVQEASTANS